MSPDSPELPILFACSGCSDVGEIADRAARQMARAGTVKMSCIAGVGGRVNGILNPLKKARRIAVIDGCRLHCAKHTLTAAGFTRFTHLSLPDLGFVKTRSIPDETAVTRVVTAVTGALATAPRPTFSHE